MAIEEDITKILFMTAQSTQINENQICAGDDVLVKIKDYASSDYALYANLKEDGITHNSEFVFNDIYGKPLLDENEQVIRV